jgi:hypothetical protein
MKKIDYLWFRSALIFTGVCVLAGALPRKFGIIGVRHGAEWVYTFDNIMIGLFVLSVIATIGAMAWNVRQAMLRDKRGNVTNE